MKQVKEDYYLRGLGTCMVQGFQLCAFPIVLGGGGWQWNLFYALTCEVYVMSTKCRYAQRSFTSSIRGSSISNSSISFCCDICIFMRWLIDMQGKTWILPFPQPVLLTKKAIPCELSNFPSAHTTLH